MRPPKGADKGEAARSMLTELHVRDFAIVGEAAIRFGPGLTVISGETGAGKSLLVDALALACGARGDPGWVRQGAERAEVAASFEVPADHPARRWLAEQGLDQDEPLIHLRRIQPIEGAARAYINGRPATVAQLRELGGLLIAIHGQHQQQRLLERDFQLALLDRLAGLSERLEELAALARRYREAGAELAALRDAGGTPPAVRIAELEEALAELEREAPTPEGLAELEAEQRRLAHAEALIAGAAEVESLLHDEEGGALRRIHRARAVAGRLGRLEPRLAELEGLLDQAATLVAETAPSLRRLLSDPGLDPRRAAEIEQRLARIHALARKYRVREGELRAHAERLRAELAALAGRGERERALLAEREALAARWRKAATELGRERAEAAERLAARVEALLGELSMAGARFRVALEPTGGAEPDPLGAERAEYLFSANPGEEPRPLRRIASGGELARVALAIEVAVLDADPIPTMVFDEVDAGIGGAVAEVVGRHLRRLGERRQVLCVTHLAQVACHGHAHLRALKEPRGERVLTRFEPLDRAMRVEEMARMLDGAAVGKESRALAGRLLAQAEAR